MMMISTTSIGRRVNLESGSDPMEKSPYMLTIIPHKNNIAGDACRRRLLINSLASALPSF